MFLRLGTVLAVALCFVASASADTLTTTFSNAEGFATGATAPVTVTSDNAVFTAIFTGGIQQQSFDGPAYNDGPDAYFFINGTYTGSFGNDQVGNTDIGTVEFSTGIDTLSFFAADRANGAPELRILGVDGSVIATETITSLSNTNASGATPFSFSSADLGQQIGGIEFDNAGPANNPPYVIAIDNFSAVVAVPEPASGVMVALVFGFVGLRRKR